MLAGATAAERGSPLSFHSPPRHVLLSKPFLPGAGPEEPRPACLVQPRRRRPVILPCCQHCAAVRCFGGSPCRRAGGRGRFEFQSLFVPGTMDGMEYKNTAEVTLQPEGTNGESVAAEHRPQEGPQQPSTAAREPALRPRRGVSSGCCCGRGGCWRQAPPKLVMLDEESVSRVNLLFSVQGCFSNAGRGIYDDPPPELFAVGLRIQDFDERIARLDSIRKMRRSCCGDCMSFVGVCLLPCFWRSRCVRRRHEIEAWDHELRAWQRDFNREVLQPLGMFVKTQSRCDVMQDRNGRHRRIERWLAFSLTPDDSAVLESEPHLFGDIEGPCCGGYDEHDVCVHPFGGR